MKKRLYFDNTFRIGFKMYIKIHDGKIREYYGADFGVATMIGGSVSPELFKTKSDFKIEKVSKYDKKEHEINANYKIISDYLFQNTFKPTYIKLNPIDKFRIDYSKKESFLQTSEIKKMIIVSAFVSIFVTIPTSLITNLLSNQNKTERINENKSVVKSDSTSITKAKTK